MLDDPDGDGIDDDVTADFEFVRNLTKQNIDDDELIEEYLIPHIITNVLKRNSYVPEAMG